MLALSHGSQFLIGMSSLFSMTVYFLIPVQLRFTITANDCNYFTRFYPAESLLRKEKYRNLIFLTSFVLIADVWLGSIFGEECDFLPIMHNSNYTNWGTHLDVLMGPHHHVIWKYKPLMCTDTFPYTSPGASLWGFFYFVMVLCADLTPSQVLLSLWFARVPFFEQFQMGFTAETVTYWCWTSTGIFLFPVIFKAFNFILDYGEPPFHVLGEARSPPQVQQPTMTRQLIAWAFMFFVPSFILAGFNAALLKFFP